MLIENNQNSSKFTGFSLVELIVALGVFSFIITISVGALLALIAANQRLQAEQSIMTNLSFALDTMTRELRTGTIYYCESAGNDNNSVFEDGEDLDDGTPGNHGLEPDERNDCRDGNNSGHNYQGVAFIEGGSSITGMTNGRILYYYDARHYNTNGSQPDWGAIMRRTGTGDGEPITSSGIYITDAEFYVSGSEALRDDDDNNDQASVTVYLEAVDAADSTMEPYRLQTTVTQRTIDL